MGRAAWKTLPPLSTCLAFAIRHTEPLEKIKYKTRLAKRGRQVGAVCVRCVCGVCGCVPSSNCRACLEFNMR